MLQVYRPSRPSLLKYLLGFCTDGKKNPFGFAKFQMAAGDSEDRLPVEGKKNPLGMGMLNFVPLPLLVLGLLALFPLILVGNKNPLGLGMLYPLPLLP